MSTQLKQRLSGVIALLFTITCFAALSGRFIPSAFADSPEIFAELTNDPSFKATDYPTNDKLKTVEVIQVAETTDGELLVYTYQPNADLELHASSINISRKAENANDHHNYALEFIDNFGVFFKYKVKDFELEDKSVRYYNISNILRPFIKGYDSPPVVGSISEVGCPVGKLFTAVTYEDTVKYYCKVIEVITITKKYVGFIRLKNGHDFYGGVSEEMTDAHFVTFSTDRPMDQLKSIHISYVEVPAQGRICFNKYFNIACDHPFAEPYDVSPTDPTGANCISKEVVINADDVFYSDEGNFHMFKAPSYSWNKIQDTMECLNRFNDVEGIYDQKEANAMVNAGDWTVNFASTKVWANTDAGAIIAPAVGLLYGGSTTSMLLATFIAALAGAYDTTCQLTQVADTLVLDLTYEKDGITYNMGVVDNKQTGSGNPLIKPMPEEIPGWVWAIIVVAAVVLFVVLFVAFPQLFSLVVQGLTFLVQMLVEFFVWIAGLIASLFHKDSGS